MDGNVYVLQMFTVQHLIVGGFVNSFQVLTVVLNNSITILLDEKGTVGKLAHKLNVTVPLAFILNKFNILRKRRYSNKAGYEQKYVAFAVQSFLKLTNYRQKCCARLC